MRYIIILAVVIILLGCAKEEARTRTYTCPDGSTVMRMTDCREEPVPTQPASTEPTIIPVAEVVTIEKDPEGIFDAYVKDKGLPYEYVSSEIQKTEDGVTYYRVRYSYGDGKRYVIVDTTGKVYDEFYTV